MRLLRTFVTAALAIVPAFAEEQHATLQVVQLSVDGRFDEPLDLGNPRPTLAWQTVQTADCTTLLCPGDQQTAYEIQAAANVRDLQTDRLLWGSGKLSDRTQQVRFGRELGSYDTIFWRVRVWDAHGQPSDWSETSTWSMGLLDQADWGEARWIEYPDRTENQPLPLFARQFDLPEVEDLSNARLYLSGVGMHYATVNGEAITDEVLAPGYSNYQLSSEYRAYDVKQALRSGANIIGVSLGNGPAYVRRSVTNMAVGRSSPYSWWQSQLKGKGTLIEDVQAGSTSVRLSDITGYHLGGSINIDTSGSGEKLESRTITSIDNSTNTIGFTPGLALAHTAGAKITGSGNNIAASDPSAGAAGTYHGLKLSTPFRL
jgi:alpha-L-rhamnosidase